MEHYSELEREDLRRLNYMSESSQDEKDTNLFPLYDIREKAKLWRQQTDRSVVARGWGLGG